MKCIEKISNYFTIKVSEYSSGHSKMYTSNHLTSRVRYSGIHQTPMSIKTFKQSGKNTFICIYLYNYRYFCIVHHLSLTIKTNYSLTTCWWILPSNVKCCDQLVFTLELFSLSAGHTRDIWPNGNPLRKQISRR